MCLMKSRTFSATERSYYRELILVNVVVAFDRIMAKFANDALEFEIPTSLVGEKSTGEIAPSTDLPKGLQRLRE